MAAAAAKTGAIAFGGGGALPVTALAVRVTDSSVGPDRLDLILVDPTVSATLVAPYSTGQATLSVDRITGFNVNDYVQVSDLTTAVVVQVTGTVGGAAPVLNIVANVNPLPRAYAPGGYVFRSRQVSYYVDTPLGAQDPLLMMDPDGPYLAGAGQPLAEGVEDFQVALGFDNNGDGVITSLGAAANDDEWVFNVAGEVAPLNLNALRVVRITIVARTVAQSAGVRGTRPAVEDHAAAPAADGYSRRVLKSEVTVRNFNL
jgi:hypothetical protein